MAGHRGALVAPTHWTADQLDTDRLAAEAAFRRERLEEPLEEYLDRFDAILGVVEDVVEHTVDLSQLREQAIEILSHSEQLEVFRYLAGPPISLDDLKTLVDTNSLSARRLQTDPDLVERLVTTIRDGLDRRRFPWVHDEREPEPSEIRAAVLASAALIATQRVATSRRTQGKREQEELVRAALLDAGFIEVEMPSRQVSTFAAAPQPGQFSCEVRFGERKADLLVGLWDRRVMPIECKVSNSSTNSVKRLNNDAAVKAGVWIADFGVRNVVPIAVLSGVYKLHNLLQAQERNLTLYWAHRLSDLTGWIEGTR